MKKSIMDRYPEFIISGMLIESAVIITDISKINHSAVDNLGMSL